MTVTTEDRDAMARIMQMMEGKTPAISTNNNYTQVELAGPGQVTNADITAMADVLTKLNSVTDQVMDNMLTETHMNHEVNLALSTQKNNEGVKIGLYQIMIKEDDKRLAGKQYYSIYNTKTSDIIADDLSLYETALKVVRLLNSGRYVNSAEVRKLFEYDDAYTSHKQDARRYKKGMIIAERKGNYHKQSLYETRYQSSISHATAAKQEIKNIVI